MNTELFKKMCRLLDYKRRSYIREEWRNACHGHSAETLSTRHIYYLTLVRLQLPCNLNHIMQITGLSSSAASTFVENMVKEHILRREEDVQDRRNILIVPTEETTEIFNNIDRRLDELIERLTTGCTPEEIQALNIVGALVCRTLEKEINDSEPSERAKNSAKNKDKKQSF